MKKEEYIKKYLKGTLSESELREFKETQDYEFMTRLDNSLKNFRAPEYQASFDSKRIQPKQQRHVFLSWSNPVLRAAASVIIVIGVLLGYLAISDQNSVKVTSTQISEVFLPDSSFVQLNRMSSLTYDKKEWQENREVSLQGEAFFKVNKGSTFDVITPSGMVRVVGTQFNVKSREDYFEVSCFEGKVEVNAAGEKILLTRNESWRLLDNSASAVQLALADKPLWTKGESQFESVPIKHVIKEFERQYDIRVKIINVDKEQLFTGSFAHDNINLALKSISVPLNLSFKLEKDQVLLSSNQ